MKKRLFGIVVLFGLVIICGGCFNQNKEKEEVSSQSIENTVISYDDIKTMEKLVDVTFVEEKDSLKVDDLTDEQKVFIVSELIGKGYTETTGTEMTNEFKKYFGKDQSIKFVDIKCGLEDHGSEEANIMLKFDTSQDKYVYNDKHPGHGGGSGQAIFSKAAYKSIEKTEKGYKMDVGVLFYDGISYDTGPFNYGNAYKSYSDAKDNNVLVKIDGNDNYKEMDMDGITTYDIDKVLEDYKDKLDVYTFNFETVDGNIIFTSYSKK